MPETFNFDPTKPLSAPKTGVTTGANLNTSLVSQHDPSKASFGGYYGDKNNVLTIDPFKDSRVTAKPFSNVPLDWSKVDPFGAAQTDQQKGWLTAGWGNDLMPLNPNGVEGTQDFLRANPQLMDFLENMGVDMGTLRAPTTTALGQDIPGINGPKVFFDRGTNQLVAQLQDFDEAAYLAANPDVQAAIDAGVLDSGREHYFTWGKDEGRELGLPAVQEAVAPDPYASPNDLAGLLLTTPTNFYDSSNVDRSRFYNAAGDLDATFKQGLDALIQAIGIAPNGTPTTVPTPAPTPAPTTTAANDPLTYGYTGGETNFFPPTTANDGAFDEAAYLANNPDVAAAVQAGAFPTGQAHWEQFGRYEPRFGGGEQKAAQTTPDGKPMRETTRVLLENLLRQTGGDPSLIEQAIPTVFGLAGREIAGGAAGALADAAAMQAGDAAAFGVDLASVPVNPADLGVELAAAGGPSWIPNPITLIKFANMLVDYFTERPPEYTTTIRGADQATIDDLLQPVLNDMGDPVPVSEGLSHGAVKGDLRDEAGNPALTRWMLPDGTPNYDMSFLMNSQLPVAGGNMSDITALLLDEMLYQNDLRLNPNANLSLTTAVEPSRKGYAWTADFGDANPISTRDMNDFLNLLMTNLRDRNLVTAR